MRFWHSQVLPIHPMTIIPPPYELTNSNIYIFTNTIRKPKVLHLWSVMRNKLTQLCSSKL